MKRAPSSAVTSKEDSILLNLKELMHLESERAHNEAAQLARDVEVAARAKADAAARAAEDEARARAAANEAAANERRREAENEAQLVRERSAAELRIRLEFEQKTRALELEKRLAHDRNVASDARAGRSNVMAIVATVAVVLATAGTLAYLGRERAFPVLANPAANAVATPTASPSATSPAAPTVAQAPAQAQPARPPARIRAQRVRVRPPRPVAAPIGLESLGEDGPADVLVGIEEARSPRRQR